MLIEIVKEEKPAETSKPWRIKMDGRWIGPGYRSRKAVERTLEACGVKEGGELSKNLRRD